jgi:diguanylate cyclase (GGDEF)-like protein
LPVTNQKEAIIAAERIRTAIESAVYAHDGAELRVTCSVGVAQVLENNDASQLIKRADAGLYQSKTAGRNCVHFHDGESCRPAADGLPGPTAPAAAPIAGQLEEPVAFPVQTIAPVVSDTEQETGFHADLRRHVTESRKFHVPLALMMVEIDRFSDLAERFGISISDLAYDTMEDFLRVVMQEMDVASRRGNGQFAIMMPATDLENAVTVAERLRMAVEGHTMQVKGVPLRLTLSAGLAEVAENDDTTTLTRRASSALFAARNGGGNCTYSHNGECCQPADHAVAF